MKYTNKTILILAVACMKSTAVIGPGFHERLNLVRCENADYFTQFSALKSKLFALNSRVHAQQDTNKLLCSLCSIMEKMHKSCDSTNQNRLRILLNEMHDIKDQQCPLSELSFARNNGGWQY